LNSNSSVCVGGRSALVLVLLLLGACGDGSSHLAPGELHSSGAPDAGLAQTSGSSEASPEQDAGSEIANPAVLFEGVSGFWRFTMRRTGSTDADISTLLLTRSENEVSGARCQTRYEPSGAELPLREQDCTEGGYSGSFVEPKLTLAQSFEENGQAYTLSMDLVVSADYSSMAGSGSSTKCNCRFEVSAVRH